MTAPLAFIDTETVTLGRGPDVIWEIGVILRQPDGDQEWSWQLRPNMNRAHPKALEVSRFHERFRVPDGEDALLRQPGTAQPVRQTFVAVALNLRLLLAGRTVVGAVPNFDTERLAMFLDAADEGPAPWHCHLCDVENLTVGYLRGLLRERPMLAGEAAALRQTVTPPWDSAALSAALGVVAPEGDRHTALGDCRWVRDMYDTVMGGDQ